MSVFWIQLLVGSLGLAGAAALAGAVLRIWRRHPVSAYRLAVLVLLAALFVPVGQLAAGRWWGPANAPLAQELWAWGDRVRTSLRSALEPSERGEAGAAGREASSPLPGVGPRSSRNGVVPENGVLTVEPELSLSEPELLALGAEWGPEGEEPSAQPMEPEAPSGLAATATVASPGSGEPLRPLLGVIAATLPWIYVLGALVVLFRSSLRLLRTRRLLHEAGPLADPSVARVWRGIARSSRFAGRVRILESPAIRTPVCFGLLRPTILVPRSSSGEAPELDGEMLTCVLLHELCHLERRDSWIMLAQELLRASFWFHPAAWWLCRRIDLLREISCDVLVVERTGRRKRYARALLEYASWLGRELGRGAKPTALLSWTSSRSQLTRRIEMLVENRSRTTRRPRTTFVAACSAFLCLWAGQLAFAAVVSPPAQEDPGAQDACAPEPARPEPRLLPLAEPIEPRPPSLLPPLQAEPAPAAEPSLSAPAPWAELAPEPRLALAPGAPSLPGPAGPSAGPSAAPGAGPGGPRASAGGPGAPSGGPAAPFGRYPAPAPVLPPGAGLQGKGPLIGVELAPVGQPTAGMRIGGVLPGSMAERARLRVGDVIVQIDGGPANEEGLARAKKRLASGNVPVVVLRGDERVTIVLPGPPRAWPDPSRSTDEIARARRILEGVPAGGSQPGGGAASRARCSARRSGRGDPDEGRGQGVRSGYHPLGLRPGPCRLRIVAARRVRPVPSARRLRPGARLLRGPASRGRGRQGVVHEEKGRYRRSRPGRYGRPLGPPPGRARSAARRARRLEGPAREPDPRDRGPARRGPFEELADVARPGLRAPGCEPGRLAERGRARGLAPAELRPLDAARPLREPQGVSGGAARVPGRLSTPSGTGSRAVLRPSCVRRRPRPPARCRDRGRRGPPCEWHRPCPGRSRSG